MPKLPKKLGGWRNREIDLGGWTAPRLTGRPHMGPFNAVSPQSLDQYPGDEVYRQHDLGYGRMSNPYLNYNVEDEKLLRSGQREWPDTVAKGVFFGKKVLDVFNTPSLYKGGYSAPKKDVYSKTSYDSSKVPWREFPVAEVVSDAGNWRVDERVRRARRRQYYDDSTFVPFVRQVSPGLPPGKLPPGYHPGLGPGGTRARSKQKGMLSSRITYS